MLKQLNKRNGHLKPKTTDKGFYYREVIASGQTGHSVIIPPLTNQRNVTMQVVAGAGNGKFQFTLDSDLEVEEGSADWFDWDKGSVTGTEQDVAISAITGLRGVSVSGEITIRINI